MSRVAHPCRQLYILHAAELRDLSIMLLNHSRMGAPMGADDESVPFATTVPLDIPKPHLYMDHFKSLYRTYRLSRAMLHSISDTTGNTSSIALLKVPSSSSLKRKLSSELGSSPSPKPNAIATKAKMAKQEALQAKAAASAARMQANREKTVLNKQTSGLPAPKAYLGSRQTPPPSIASVATPPPSSSSPKPPGSASAIAVEIAVSSPALSSSSESGNVSAAGTPSPSAQNPQTSASVASEPKVPAVHSETEAQKTIQQLDLAESGPPLRLQPLHPTLQQLAPNPLSVTYASSLRPLPPDPFRRSTGCGLGGGAHHRVRKSLQLPAPKLGVPPPMGPAGAGQADLWRWYVRSRASPGAGLVGKADKCLLTRDWRVAFAEQRFLRAMARIEKLKESGNWSFRQPKKQKGPAVRKAHWDYVLDEMKWMQTDYREERRWKLAAAHHLAHACKAWIKARSTNVRAALTVKVRAAHRHVEHSSDEAGQIKSEVVDGDMDVLMTDGVGARHEKNTEPQNSTPMEDALAVKRLPPTVGRVDSENQPVRASPGCSAKAFGGAAMSANVTDGVDVGGDTEVDAEADADVDADGEAEDDGDADPDADADDGEVEAAIMALEDQPVSSGAATSEPATIFVHEPRPSVGMPDLSASAASAPDGLAEKDGDSATLAMRATASLHRDETLAADPHTLDRSALLHSQNAESLPINIASSLRAPIFSMDVSSTLVSPTSLLQSFDAEAAADLLGMDMKDLQALLDSSATWSISALFPELPKFEPPAAPDRGKLDKRWDDGSLNQLPRLTQISRMLDAKPVLVSTLEPAKNRAHGRWKDDSDWVLAAKLADPHQGVSRHDAELQQVPATTLFTRRSNKPGREAPASGPNHVMQPSQSEIRAAQIFWTTEEDAFLMNLVQTYGLNWPLVSDVFISTRLSVPTDRREPWDCYDRWDRITKAAAQGKPPPAIPQLPSTATPAAAAESATLATKDSNGAAAPPTSVPFVPPVASVAAKREKLTKKLTTKFDGSRKKMRHSNILEVMRKTAKRREASFKPPHGPGEVRKVNLASHETHNTPKGGQTPTPQQLSTLKADRDEAQMRQYYLYQQRRFEEQQRMVVVQAQQQSSSNNQQSQQASHGGQQGNTANPAPQAQAQPQPQVSSVQTNQPQAAGSQPQPQPQQRQHQQQQHQQQHQQPIKATSVNAGRPQVPTVQHGSRPSSAAGIHPGTPTQGAQPQANQANQQQQQQQGLAALPRMTPQQHAAFNAQMRPSLQSYSMAVSQSITNGIALATARSPMQAFAVASGSPANNLISSQQVSAHSQQQSINGGASSPSSGAMSIGGLPAVAVQQIEATLQSTVAQNLSQEQVQHLALQLFRNAHQQHQAQQQQQGVQVTGLQLNGAQGQSMRPPPMGLPGPNGAGGSSPRPSAPVPQQMPLPPRPTGSQQGQQQQQHAQQGQQGSVVRRVGAGGAAE